METKINWPRDFINKTICGDSISVMKEMPDECVDMVMTSPPYWGLRDYGIKQIIGGDPGCKHKWGFSKIEHDNLRYRGHNANVGSNKNPKIHKGKEKSGGQFCCRCAGWKGQLGLEPTPEMYIEHLTEFFNEVKRTLKKEGTFWLNIGDTYWGGKGKSGYELPHEAEERRQKGKTIQRSYNVPGYMEMRPGNGKHDFMQPKSLCMIPERLAWSLIQNGWILRNKIPWIKPNSIPSSAKDRYTNKYEFVYYFVKSQRNYFDLDSIREPLKKSSLERLKRGIGESQRYGLFPKYGGGGGINKPRMNVKFNYRVRDAIKKRSEAPDLYKASKEEIEKYQYQDTAECNLAGKNPGDIWVIPTASFPYDYCISCKRLLVRAELIFKNKRRYCSSCKEETMSHFSTFPEELCKKAIIPGCPESGIILDPFCGAGTALFVAKQLRRRFIGIDIKQEYCDMSEKRIEQGVL